MFIIKRNLQKSKQTGLYMSDILTEDILKDICIRITGQEKYTVRFVDNRYQDGCLPKSYNKGRLAIFKYGHKTAFISFSEVDVGGRNSAVQSVGSAFNIFYQSRVSDKKLYYYFLGRGSKFETDYLRAIYRQMQTIGFHFLNPEELSMSIDSFSSIEDLIFSRRITSGKNKSNNSSYITKESATEIEVYGKTYGANKYAAAMLGYTASAIAKPGQHITFYEVLEGDLKHMPKPSVHILKRMGNVDIVPTKLEFDKKLCKENNNLRSPRYKLNLLDRIGVKHCALCHCEIPEIVQGAHVWPVHDIKKQPFTFDEQFKHATSGDNGIWLCENHHKLFDEHIIRFDKMAKVHFHTTDKESLKFLHKITLEKKLDEIYFSDNFFKYLEKRNNAI